jgi:hypothetical protein
MANYGNATKVEFSRWLGLVDEDDPTNLPMGCAALSQNCRFNLTEIETRYGVQTAIQGKNASPISGLLGCAYTPESATQAYFQAILLYDYLGSLQIENPTGTGRTVPISNPIVTLPAKSHMIGAQAYNRAWMGFSNLLTPTAFPSVYDLYTKQLYPYGMKPVGFGWYAGAKVLVGECCTPSQLQSGVPVPVSNGHLYICIQAGTLGQNQPVWPLNEGGTVADGGAIWKEQTPVMANRLPAPASPVLALAAGGSIGTGLDVYVAITLINQQGESTAGTPAKITTIAAGTTVNVTLPTLGSMVGWIRGLPVPYVPTKCRVYVAFVTAGAAAPQLSAYTTVYPNATYTLGSVVGITVTTATAVFPPTTNSARITGGQLPTPDVEPIITRAAGGGTFLAGRDIYILQTYINALGETLPGPANSLINTLANDAVLVNTQFPEGYAVTGINLYECDVPTGTVFDGSTFPPFENFALFGTFGTGQAVTITAPVSGPPPPTTNTTGVAGNIAQDTATGGPNGTQGYRWMTIAFQDMFDTISGFTQASAVSYVVDENGWELSVFNLPTGPNYIQNVICNFTVADGLSAGPYAFSPVGLISDSILITSTVFPNGTSSATVNFSDDYLLGLIASTGTNTTDRLRVIQPQQCVDIYYSEATDRIFQTGVPGFYSGHWVSLAGDPESYYGDTSGIQVGTDDGERAWCVREYQGVPYSLRERSGFELAPSTADPATWTVTKRWTKVGPCGPRAVDVCGQFVIFIHSSGVYKYEESAPMLVSKELNRFWNTINWQAQQTIWCAIDVEFHEVHIGLPVGSSTVPNVVLVLNYEEGWNNPLLFSRYSGKEITIEACRKYSVWTNITAYLGARAYRSITGEPVPNEGPVDTTEESSRQYISQFLYASSAPDGTVQALTPGVYNDNGAGIDCQYESVAAQEMMTLCKLQGINMNCRGNGSLFMSFIAGARRITDWQDGTPQPSWLVTMKPIQLELNPTKGISRNTPSRLNERWRCRYTNGAIADAWFSMKYSCVFISPMFAGRLAAESK